ncbi:microcin B17-processing protein McbD [Pseudomonas sp. MPR-R2A7]|nr:microcin B17-processing protein McbD [Pseudomonas sp. GW460-12]PMX30143.1 microcin B17-processing protein McbD [Pseudomonas sp. MPR-R2A4]PMX34784.1 microcin B17-processing protein McbD [Pseudomonas sp. MPR-R2A7]PMX47700.1 microcin B17-processing protein McbD [Pseudomonas sp. MPR-R2A6]PMX83058.1 microcin B17-processing protein McbD [Pseudomonas sp. MPR-R2A3]PMY06168.1 microcin B17-processing protein McbD [Pseudomonas sp. MPR-R2A5]PNA23587.1 microcin B17-processing protein McbD [Pseudomonas 
MQKPDLPGSLLFQPAGLLALPNSVEVSDALSVNGSGVGEGSNSIKTALGEYFERRHFYREILSSKQGFLNESLRDAEVDSFVGAFIQTASKSVSIREVENHKFTLSKVVRALDFSTCFIPTICISLSSHRLEDDNFIYPLRDTCGCSFHWCPNFAFLGAVKEYLERQFLVKFWLTKKCHSIVPPGRAFELLSQKKSGIYTTLSSLLENSRFLIFLTFGFRVFVYWLSMAETRGGHHVNYCAGMSYAAMAGDALEKSILELWQTYRFMDLFKAIGSDEEKVEDYYLRYFLSCNVYETYRDITDVQVVAEEKRDASRAGFTLSGFLSVLNDQGILGYFYARHSMVNGVGCVFSKYVSPDLFLHMNNSKNINFSNKYSKEFAGAILQSRLEKMVPFP